MRAVYESQYSADPQIFVDRALEVVERGYTAFKVLITPSTESLNHIGAYDYSETMMAAMREAVGNDVDIMVDCHGRHFPANAVEFCRVLAPYRPYFIEEPVPPENVDALAEVRKDGSYDAIVNLVMTGVAEPVQHQGIMLPKGGTNISDDDVRAVAAYVWTLNKGD